MPLLLKESLLRLSRLAAAALLAASLLLATAHPASAQFYKDKTVSLLINSGAGGNSDLLGRLFMRYMGKYIPGSPVLVPRNVVGAGGLLGTNALANTVKPDGLTFGIFLINGGFAQLIGAPELHASYSDFEFIAGISTPIVSFIRRDVKPGIEKPEDIVKADLFYAAGYNRDSTHDVLIRLTLDIVGARYKMVTAYPDATKVFLATLRNEVQYSSTSLGGYRNQVIPNMVEPGLALITWQYPQITPDGEFRRNNSIADIPTFVEIYERIYGKRPSGIVWDAFVQVQSSASITRAIVAPKGTPPEAVADLRHAVTQTAADPDFQADYLKMMGEAPSIVPVADGQRILKKLEQARPDVKAFLADFVK